MFIDDWFSPDRVYDQDAGLSISILDDYYTAKERVVPWDTYVLGVGEKKNDILLPASLAQAGRSLNTVIFIKN